MFFVSIVIKKKPAAHCAMRNNLVICSVASVILFSPAAVSTDADWWQGEIDVLGSANFMPTRHGYGKNDGDPNVEVTLDPNDPDALYACITIDLGSSTGAIATFEAMNFGFIAYDNTGTLVHRTSASITSQSYWKYKNALVVRYVKNADGHYDPVWQVPIGNYASNYDYCKGIFVTDTHVIAYTNHDQDNYAPHAHDAYTYGSDGVYSHQSASPPTEPPNIATDWAPNQKFNGQQGGAQAYGSSLNGLQRPQITKFLKATGQPVWIENFKVIMEDLYTGLEMSIGKDLPALYARLDPDGTRLYCTFQTFEVQGTTWGSRYYGRTVAVDISSNNYNENPSSIGSSMWNVLNFVPGTGAGTPEQQSGNIVYSSTLRSVCFDDAHSKLLCTLQYINKNDLTIAPWNTATGTPSGYTYDNMLLCYDLSADKATIMGAADGHDPAIVRNLGPYVNAEWNTVAWHNGMQCSFADDGTSRIVITSTPQVTTTVNPHLAVHIYDHATDTITHTPPMNYPLAEHFDEDAMEDLTNSGYANHQFCTGDGYCYRLVRHSNNVHNGHTSLYNALLVQIDLSDGSTPQLYDFGEGRKMHSGDNIKGIAYSRTLNKVAFGGQTNAKSNQEWSRADLGTWPNAGAIMYQPTSTIDYPSHTSNTYDAWVGVMDIHQSTGSPTITGYVPPPTTSAPTDAHTVGGVFAPACGTAQTNQLNAVYINGAQNFFLIKGYKRQDYIYNVEPSKLRATRTTHWQASGKPEYIEKHDATTGECLWIRPLTYPNKYYDYQSSNLVQMFDTNTIMAISMMFPGDSEPATLTAHTDDGVASDNSSPKVDFIHTDGSYLGTYIIDATNSFGGLWTGKVSANGPAPSYWRTKCAQYDSTTKHLWMVHAITFPSTTTQTILKNTVVGITKHKVENDYMLTYVGHAWTAGQRNMVFGTAADAANTVAMGCTMDPSGNFFVTAQTNFDTFVWNTVEQQGNYGYTGSNEQALVLKYGASSSGQFTEAWGRTWYGINIDAQESLMTAKETSSGIDFDIHDVTYEPVSDRIVIGVDARSDDDEYQIYSLRAIDGRDVMVHTSRMQGDAGLLALRATETGGTASLGARGNSQTRNILHATGTGSLILVDELYQAEGFLVEFTPDFTQGGTIAYAVLKHDIRLNEVYGFNIDVASGKWVASGKGAKYVVGTFQGDAATFTGTPPTPTCASGEVLDQETNSCHSVCSA